MTSESNILNLVQRSVDDIPAMLEVMAKEIRDGEHGTVTAGAGVFLTTDGEVMVCGWGKDATDVHSVGLLHIGAAWLAANKVQR